MAKQILFIASCVLIMIVNSELHADVFSDYTLTTQAYAWDADMDAAVAGEFGPLAQVADWVDLETYFTGVIAEFCDAVGLETYRSHAWVYRNGQAFYSSNRHYFVERHNGNVPGGWLVHDYIDSHTLSLGSWYNSRQILVRLPDTPLSVEARSWGGVKQLYR